MKKLLLKKAKLTDSKFIFNLYNKAVNDNFFNTKKTINFFDHQIWFRKKYKSVDTKILICYLNLNRIGYIKYDFITSKSAKISINLSGKFRKKKLGSKILDKSHNICQKKFGIRSVYAEVLKSNKYSKYFFLKNGYKSINIRKKFKNEFSKKNLVLIKQLNLN